MNYKYLKSNIEQGKNPIVKSIFRIKDDKLPNLFFYESQTYKKFNDAELTGFGVSYLEYEAINKAIGECIERYSATVPNYRKLIYGSYESLRDYNKINIKNLNYFSDEQYDSINFPFIKLTENIKLHWIQGFELNENIPTLIPAEYIYLNYSERNEKLPSTHYSISTGLACHTNKENAILSSIFEVIERDSYMMVWKRKIEVPHLDINSIEDTVIKRLLSELYKKNIDVHLIDVSMEYNIPTILAIAFSNNKDMPPLSVDIATSFSYKNAIVKALYGLSSTVLWGLINLHRTMNISILNYHAIYYFNKEHHNNIRFLLNGPSVKYKNLNNIIKSNSTMKILEEVNEILKNEGFNVYICDITPRDVMQMGYYVIKSIIPNMVPLDIDVRYTYDGVKRIYQLPSKLKKYNYSEKINRDIHPFA
jgi:ribosomal protein S12 methylthiotransferase accessory factor